MSFVLEALRKQEAGNDPDAAVSLARSTRQWRRYRLWAALFVVAMIVNGALLTWIAGGQRLLQSGAGPADIPTPPAGGPATAPARLSEQPAASVAVEAAPALSSARTTPSATMHTGPADARPANAVQAAGAAERTVATAAASAGPTRIRLADLPATARARFPGLAFSTHIYSDDADLRAVVANGHRLKEGDRIRGLKIVEITETGVVLTFENYLVEVPIVADWDHP